MARICKLWHNLLLPCSGNINIYLISAQKGGSDNEEVKKGNEDAIMTDANDSEAKEMPISTGEKILAIEATTKVDFTIPDELKGKKRVCRFPMNPEAHWGPKKAASGYKRKPEEDE